MKKISMITFYVILVILFSIFIMSCHKKPKNNTVIPQNQHHINEQNIKLVKCENINNLEIVYFFKDKTNQNYLFIDVDNFAKLINNILIYEDCINNIKNIENYLYIKKQDLH